MNYENPNPQQSSRLRRMFSNNTVRIILAGVVLLSISFGAYALVDPLRELQELEEKYATAVEQTNYLAKKYNLSNHKRCMLEVELAHKKLELYHAEDLDLTKEEYVRISNKAQWVCEPQGDAEGFPVNP
jgi:hypothetical protein